MVLRKGGDHRNTGGATSAAHLSVELRSTHRRQVKPITPQEGAMKYRQRRNPRAYAAGLGYVALLGSMASELEFRP